jgi:hypothetical protein
MTRHSETRSDTETRTPDSSQARLAAEAAFAPRPIALAANAEPQVVVIKRKKTIVPAGEGDPFKTESQEPIKEGRAPRVFRIDSGPAVKMFGQPKAVGADTDFDASVGVDASTAQVVQITRRRPRNPRAEVTIIRPAASGGTVGGDLPASREAKMPPQELKPLEPCFAALRAAQDFDLGIATSGGGAPSRYQALTAKIRKLEQRAEAARKVEATKAVRWIKRAIAAYDLRASDLGL